MIDNQVTFSGYVGSEVVVATTSGGHPVCTFRVASTPRRLKGGQWTSEETVWYTVKAWRALAENLSASLVIGDAVMVHGRIGADVWQKDDNTTSVRYVVTALSVGHDLNRGVSTFEKRARVEVEGGSDEVARRLLDEVEAQSGRMKLDAEGVPSVNEVPEPEDFLPDPSGAAAA